MVEQKARTIKELRNAGYKPVTVKQEMRRNLVRRIEEGQAHFPGIIGYEDTVLPHLENAILSGQDIIFLGERGQARSPSSSARSSAFSTMKSPSSPAARSTTTLSPLSAGVAGTSLTPTATTPKSNGSTTSVATARS